MLKLDVSSKEKEAMKSKELLKEHQTSELYQKNEVRRYLNTAREGMERERQDRYLLLVEQNKLKHKVEKLSENCKSYQVKLYYIHGPAAFYTISYHLLCSKSLEV